MIYIIEAPPGEGKSLFMTELVMKELKKKKGKKVFTNYPVIFSWKNQVLSSFVWKNDYLIEGVEGSMIVLDEAWQYFSSREWKKFSVEIQQAFATNRHNENDYYLIVQHHARLDIIIREVTSKFYVLRKTKIPFTEKPLWFTLRVFLTELDVDSFNSTKNKELIYVTERFRLKKQVARAYDTHYFKRPSKASDIISWADKLKVDNCKSLSGGGYLNLNGLVSIILQLLTLSETRKLLTQLYSKNYVGCTKVLIIYEIFFYFMVMVLMSQIRVIYG